MTAHLFRKWFMLYYKATVESYCSEKKKRKKIYSKILLLMDNSPVHLRTLRMRCNETNVVFMLANATWIFFFFWPMDLILTFHKAIAGIDSDPSNSLKDLGKVN